MAKIADNCAKPLWGDNFRSVFRETYRYVMHWDWEARVPAEEDGEDREWLLEYYNKKWDVGERACGRLKETEIEDPKTLQPSWGG